MSRPRRSPMPRRAGESGFVLIALIALLAMGGLYFFISNLTPEAIEARRQQKSNEALAQARDALLGYVIRYREANPEANTNALKEVYGYLPLPDLGSARNQNNLTGTVCEGNLEGCEALNFTGNGAGVTVIGRFPWRTLGTGPLRDGHGECLWYAVSGSHQRMQQASPMNWDTLSQLNVVIADGTASMKSAIASAHDRPIAVIFSPGPSLPGQDRTKSPIDTSLVDECGGNYTVSNYLDPGTTPLGGVANYFAGTATPSHDDKDAIVNPKNLTTQGTVSLRSDDTLWQGACPPSPGNSCTATVANDIGLGLTSDQVFRTLRGSGGFRADINTMLDRMVSCLRDELQTPATFTPMTLADPSAVSTKAAGRIYSSSCFDDTATPVNTVNPKGYFTHYRDQIFVAACPGSLHTVVTDPGPSQQTLACAGALVFSGPRDPPTQSRTNTTARNTASNYLEDDIATDGNLSGFSALLNTDYASCTTARRFAGAGTFSSLASGQTTSQDVVRCIPSGASLSLVAPSVAATGGAVTLASYAPTNRTLTLGSAGINSNAGALPEQLFACAWNPESHAGGSGFRSYFRFRIRQVGEGFTFAVVDGDRNTSAACGAARQHLGYSGDNGATPYIQAPKLAIEFDTARNSNSGSSTYNEALNTLSNGRNDPCYLSSCGAAQNLASNAHVAVMYWGYEAVNASPTVNQPKQDDNVHGFPWPPDASARPAPRNAYYAVTPYPDPPPDPALGVAPLDRMGATSPLSTAPAKREFHARVEVTRSFTAPADAKDGATGVQVKLWIEPHAAANISAMTYTSGSPPTVSVTAASHGLATDDYAVIKDVSPAGFNGEYRITKIDADNFIATLPDGKTDPGRYISQITWSSVGVATVISANHGLATGDIVNISGAVPTEYNGNKTITWIDANSYSFPLALSYEPGNMPPGIAAARALSPRAIALANTTRSMADLDPAFKAFVTNSATIYDEQLAVPDDCTITPCSSGNSCGSDKKCYRPSFRNLRLGFTIGERVTSSTSTARGQLIEIKDRATTWLP